jgi:hypothetical protein
MIIQSWSEALNAAFYGFAPAALQFAAFLLAAIIIFVIGWIIGSFIGKLVQKLFQKLNVDHALRQAGMDSALRKGDINLNSGAFVGGLVKWFIIAIFFLAALRVLGLTQVTVYLEEVVVGYLPHVIIAVLILLASVVIAGVVQKVVVGAASAANISSANVLGLITKWAIIVFAVLTALVELNIAASLIQILFIGIVVAFSLAFGLAFGLGGREAAARAIDRASQKISR